MNEKIKKVFSGKLLLIVAIVSIVMFAGIVCVPLCKFMVIEELRTGDDVHNSVIYGFNALFGGLGIKYAGISWIFAAVISWMIFSMFTILVVMLILAVTAFRRKKAKNILLLIAISIALFFAVMYMIAGFVVSSSVNVYYDSERYSYLVGRNPYTGQWIFDYYYADVTTSSVTSFAYLPVIIQVLCFVLGLMSFIITAKSNTTVNKLAVQNVYAVGQASYQVNDNNTIESIKKYKELLDVGEINQEEYDIKKKELLGL